MPQFTSPVYSGGDPSLGDLFPTYFVEPEKAVFEAVHDATFTRLVFPDSVTIALTLPAAFDVPAALPYDSSQQTQWGFWTDPQTGRSYGVEAPGLAYTDSEWPTIPVIRGYPAYPAHVPGIGVFLSPEHEDDARRAIGGEFAGDLVQSDASGNTLGAASYYSYPQHSTVVVELIHENRDERDRLHAQLWRLLGPLERRLPGVDRLYRTVSISAEKQELPIDEQPLPLYISLFTVEVDHEMLEAVDVVGPAGVITAPISVTVTNDPTIPIPPGG